MGLNDTPRAPVAVVVRCPARKCHRVLLEVEIASFNPLVLAADYGRQHPESMREVNVTSWMDFSEVDLGGVGRLPACPKHGGRHDPMLGPWSLAWSELRPAVQRFLETGKVQTYVLSDEATKDTTSKDTTSDAP